jgi:hypothetical protein
MDWATGPERAGFCSPKVLVRALGITDKAAIKYWAAFAPRIRDEMKAAAAAAGDNSV